MINKLDNLNILASISVISSLQAQLVMSAVMLSETKYLDKPTPLTREHIDSLVDAIRALGAIAAKHNLYGIDNARRDVMLDVGKLIQANGVLLPEKCKH